MSDTHQAAVDLSIAPGGVPGELVGRVSVECGSMDVRQMTTAMARGSEAAFEQFFGSYVDRLFRYLLVVSGGREELTRDALQGTLIRIARHVRAFSTTQEFWNWLTVLARSACIDEQRRQCRYRKMLETFGNTQVLEPPEEVPDDRDLDGMLQSALATLSAEDRQLIEAKYTGHQTIREISEASGASEKAIESRLTRIRRSLRDNVLSRLQQREEP